MRTIHSILRYVMLGLALVGTNLLAGSSPDGKPSQTGGLSVSFVTSGYRFLEPPPDGVVTPARKKTIASADADTKASFVASVCLSNRSRSAIKFTFDDGGPHWTFVVVDPEGEEIWWSDSDVVSPQVITEEELAPGKSWKLSATIPLVIDGAGLAPGVYTLQAYLNADKPVSATSVFEVVPNLPELDHLCQHWVHSREEEQSGDKDQIFRPAAFKKFPPSWFRMEYKFARKGDCEWLYLDPADAHRLKSGKWTLDPKDKTIIRITKDGTTSSYRITALGKDILRLLPVISK